MTPVFNVEGPVQAALDAAKGRTESVLVLGWDHSDRLVAYSGMDEFDAVAIAARFIFDVAAGHCHFDTDKGVYLSQSQGAEAAERRRAIARRVIQAIEAAS